MENDDIHNRRQFDQQLETQVAVLKTEFKNLSEEVKDMKNEWLSHVEREEQFQEEVLELNAETNKQITAITNKISKYQGTVGGLMLAFSAITAFLGLFKDWILSHLK